MDGDTSHSIDEFGNFPWSQITPIWLQQVGGIGRGGVHAGLDLNPRKPFIGFYHGPGFEDCWEIPEELGKLVEQAFDNGKDRMRSELKQLLKIGW